MNNETLLVNITAGVATITLHRPDVRHAFNETMIHELTQTFQALGQNTAVKVIVLAASGQLFCAGADLNWMKKQAGYLFEENRLDAERLAMMLYTVHTCPQPVIAKIQGDCYGGGVGLAAASDMVVASKEAHFCLSEVKLGLIPATIGPYVIKAIGARFAHRYFLTAERFDATTAAHMGLVHEVVDHEKLDAHVEKWSSLLKKNGPQAMARAKQLIHYVASKEIDTPLIKATAEDIAHVRVSKEAQEGITAFLNKRLPNWCQE